MAKYEASPTIAAEEVVRAALEDDPQRLADLVDSLTEEHNRWHEHNLNLVASHNLISPRAMALMRSNLIENASSGPIGARSHTGTALLDRIETLLVELAKKLFGVTYVEHRPPSGALANGLFFFGALDPGDRVMALSPKYGGHCTYLGGSYPGVKGLNITDVPCYGDDYPEVDLELLAEEVERAKPKWIVVGSATLLFPYPLREIAEIAGRVEARILFDGAHILGLAPNGQFQDPPHEGAAVMTGSTQKTLGGPVGGLILMHDGGVAERVTSRTSSFISSYNNNRTAALAITLAELLAFGKEYAQAVVSNAQTLARSLDAEGFTVAGKERGFTQSHVVLVDLETTPHGTESVRLLEQAHISSSLADLPRTYPRKSVLRLGSPACTKRGMDVTEMTEVARLIRRVILDGEDPKAVGKDVADLASSVTGVHYCF